MKIKRKHEHQVSTYVKPGLKIRIKTMAREKGISISQLVAELLLNALQDRK